MWLLIEPCDVLFFRDSKPFAAGEQSAAQSGFPPPATALIGALRSQMFEFLAREKKITIQQALKNKDCIEIIGDSENLGSLRFQGPFLYHQPSQQLYLPWPQDMYITDDETQTPGQLVPVEPSKAVLPSAFCLPDKYMNLNHTPFFLEPDKKGIEIKGSIFFNGLYLADYLLNNLDLDLLQSEDNFCLDETICLFEPRTGIGMQKHSRTTQKGMLYTINCMRLNKDYCFLMSVTNKNQPVPIYAKGAMRLGGEGKVATYAIMNNCDEEPLQETRTEDFYDELIEKIVEQDQPRIKILLLSPGIFQYGWLPDIIDPASLTWQIAGTELQLLTAATGKHILIGGWNLAENRPRTLYRAVPGGSVYFLQAKTKLTRDQAREIIRAAHWQTLISKNKDMDFYRAAGFGLAVMGVF